jgi:hypothetical protein
LGAGGVSTRHCRAGAEAIPRGASAGGGGPKFAARIGRRCVHGPMQKFEGLTPMCMGLRQAVNPPEGGTLNMSMSGTPLYTIERNVVA